MAIRIFTISIQDNGESAQTMNGFLASHRILSVDRRWVDQGAGSFWCFCVDYLEGASLPGPPKLGMGKNRIDYREKLKPEDFIVFAKLREERKEIADAAGVPVYTIFTNEQLAQMVEKKAKVKADLELIAGVGDGRIEKYGERMLAILNQTVPGSLEADGKPL